MIDERKKRVHRRVNRGPTESGELGDKTQRLHRQEPSIPHKPRDGAAVPVPRRRLHGAEIPGGGVWAGRGLRVGLFWMERGHRAVNEMENEGNKDQRDEEAAEKEFARVRLVGVEQQVVHGEIDTGRTGKVPRRKIPIQEKRVGAVGS